MATATLGGSSMTKWSVLIVHSSTIALAMLVVLISTATAVIHIAATATTSLSWGLLWSLHWWALLLTTSIAHSIRIAVRVATKHANVSTSSVSTWWRSTLVEAATCSFIVVLSMTIAAREFPWGSSTFFVVWAYWLLLIKAAWIWFGKVTTARCKLRTFFALLPFFMKLD